MIAFAIIAILATFSFSSFSSFLNRSYDQVLQAQLMDAIQLARQEAKIRRAPIAICQTQDHLHCVANGSAGFLVFQNVKQDGVVANKNQIIAVISANTKQGQWLFHAYPIYRHFILFFPLGHAQSDNGRFWYCRSHAELPEFALVLNQSGNVYLVKPDKDGVIKDTRGKVLRC